MFTIHFFILLVVILVGIRHGGIAFGLLGGLGVSLLTFGFGVAPGQPPISVMLIILAVVAASATLEATGGLKLLVNYAERLLRKHPNRIVFLGPLCTYSLTVLVGTGHSVYPLLPVIYDVAYKKGIRPERPMAMATVASQMGITASPIAAAAAVVMATAADNQLDISLIDVLLVTFPATLLGVLAGCFYSLHRGKDLAADPEFADRLNNPDFKAALINPDPDSNDHQSDATAKRGLLIFLCGIGVVVFVALFSRSFHLLPEGVGMSTAIQFLMLSVGAVILLATNVKPKKIAMSSVFTAGMSAVIIIFGIAWLSDTIISFHKPMIIEQISGIVGRYPWAFAFAMFASSVFLKSQAAVLTIMFPLGFALGVDPIVLIGCIPACYGYYVLPFYPSDLAAIEFDRSGTTRIGKYILNHSFMLPGLIGVSVATITGYFIATSLV